MSTKRIFRLFALLLALVMCVASFASCGEPEVDPKEEKYEQAYDLLETGEYENAYALFTELGDYKNAKVEASKFRYVPTKYSKSYIDGEDSGSSTFVISLNENNLPKEIVETRVDGYKHTCVFTYNEKGKIVNVSCTDTDGDTMGYVCTYDEKGNIAKEVFTEKDGAVNTYEYTYDAEGRLIKYAVSDDLSDDLTYSYTYDEDGREDVCVIINEGEKTIRNAIYDENGNIVRAISKDESGNVVSEEQYEYNAAGNRTKAVLINGGKILATFEYTFDEKGQPIREYSMYGSEFYFSYDYSYDANGNRIKSVCKYGQSYEDTLDVEFKFVYIPFEYSDEEWKNLVEKTENW